MKTWIVILLRVWMTSSSFIYFFVVFISLFISFPILFIYLSSFIASFPSFFLFIFLVLFFILFLLLTPKPYHTFLLDVSPHILSDSWCTWRHTEILDGCLWTPVNFSALFFPTQTWLRPVTTCLCKPEAANTVRVPDDERYAARNILSPQWTVE